MAHIVTKKIKGKEYLYLVESVREKERVRQKTIKYLGKKRTITAEEFECIKYSHSGKDWYLDRTQDQLSYQIHAKMREASKKHQERIEELDEVSRQKEKERFLSRFIADSNAIEGSAMSREETRNYLFEDIVPESHSKKELYMAENLLSAWNYVEENHKKKITEKDLKELQKRVNNKIETDQTLGKYKKVQNYIGDVFTTSHYWVEERMKQLMQWIHQGKLDDFEIAFQSHSQFETIHPFIDGNGRVGRLLINWILLNKELSPLAIQANRRAKYISALENSRKGKIEAICKFCSEEYLEQYKTIL